MNIVVLCGGLSPERNVSLSSGTKIASALMDLGHKVVLVDMFFGLEDYAGGLEGIFDAPPALGGTRIDEAAPDLEVVRASRKLRSDSMFGDRVLEVCGMADIVFMALHGRCGEDGKVQAAFDLLGIKYTGSGHLGSAIAMDKDLTKRVVAPLGVLTPEWKLYDARTLDPEAVCAEAALPCVVKPVDSGSSIGVDIAHTRVELLRALDSARAEGGALYMGRPENDQSYMLCRILPEQLRRLVLPLGGMIKAETRALAEKWGLPAAKKPDSMELCFVPDGDYAAWLDRRGDAPAPGELIFEGRAVARHGGIHRYTLGQRRGLGYAAGRRVYVSEIRPETGEVVLAEGAGLFVSEFTAGDMRWLVPAPEEPFDCAVRIRHSRALAPARALPLPGGRLRFTAAAPLRAPTPGQAAAVYVGSQVLGGGFLLHDTKDTN